MNKIKYNFNKTMAKGCAQICISDELIESFNTNFFPLLNEIDMLRCIITKKDGETEFAFTDLTEESELMIRDMVKMLSETVFPKKHEN